MTVPQSINGPCHAVFLRCRDFPMKPEQRTRQEKIDIQLGRAGWSIGIRRLIRPGWAGHDVDLGRFFRIPEWVNPARILPQPAADLESRGAKLSEPTFLARVVQETPIPRRMKQPKPNAALSALPGDYANLLSEVKQRVRSAQIRAAMAASAELLALHWDIGRMILDRQKREGWGAKVIDRLAADLQGEFPGRQGFSPRNLKYMRAFAEAWPGGVFVQPAVAQITKEAPSIVQPAIAQLPWKHHTILLNKLTTSEDRLWYAVKAVENGWSGNILALQIDSGLHLRQGKAITNFKLTHVRMAIQA